MDNTNPGKATPSWRPEPQETPVEEESTWSPEWRREPEMPIRARRRRTRLLKVGAFCLFFGVTLGVWIWVLLWYVPLQSSSIVLVGTAYEKNLELPPNTYGMQTLVDILGQPLLEQRFLFKNVGVEKLGNEVRPFRVDVDWADGIEVVKTPTLIVYFSAHGGADQEGAYLLPQDARIANTSEDRVRMRSVIQRLGKLPKSLNKILVLDVTDLEVYWPLGMLTNQFARELEAINQEIVDVPNLVVLCASGIDERSWASPEWRQTVYGHFFLDGLRGAGDKDRNGRVSVAELHTFLQQEVSSWVRTNRGATQTPMLLPLGREGTFRAESIQLAEVPEKFESETAKDPPRTTIPPELNTAWQKYEQLAKSIPPPSTHSPELWEQYLFVLLRFDELMRQGATEQAANLSVELDDLEQDLSQARQIQLSSLQNSLQMPVIAGQSVAGSSDDLNSWNKLWSAAPKDVSKVWASIQKPWQNLSDEEQRLRRLVFFQYLVKQAEQLPSSNIKKAAGLAQLMRDPRFPLPAEVNYLLMLSRGSDLPFDKIPAQYASLPEKSIEIGQLGEQAALGVGSSPFPYSGRIQGAIRPLIDAADSKRRLAQDLLFTPTEDNYASASKLMTVAQQGYEGALKRAETIQAAIQLRDQVMPILPYFSQWVAGRQIPNVTQARPQNEKLVKMTSLWHDTHELMSLVNQATRIFPDASESSASNETTLLSKLAEQTARVSSGYQSVANDYATFLQSVSDSQSPTVWRDLENALRVPYPDASLRLKIIQQQQQVSRNFLLAETATETLPAMPTASEKRSLATQYAYRQGKMALEVIGQELFDSTTAQGVETYDQVQHRLATFEVDREWWDSIMAVGDQEALRWLQLPTTINNLCRTSKTEKSVQVTEDLQQADSLARQLDGVGSFALTESPGEIIRRDLITELMLWLSERTYLDHWFAYDPTAEPYYRFAGLIYLDDAWRLAISQSQRDEIQKQQSRLNAPGTLTIEGPAVFNLTSQLSFMLDYSIAPSRSASVPEGYVTLWPVSGENIDLTLPQSLQRLIRQHIPNKKPAILSCTAQSPLVVDAEKAPGPKTAMSTNTSITIEGLYRGQQIKQSTSVDIFPLADIYQRRINAPQNATLAVRAAGPIYEQFGASNAAVSIIVDCSGSMAPSSGVYDSSTKYVEATTALGQVLSNLAKGTQVSLWVFGQAVGPEKTVPPEQTIQRIYGPAKWDPANLSKVMAEVSYPKLQPWNESPIVASMVAAKNDLVRIPGFKTMIVITDGMDNRFANDTTLNPGGLDISAFLYESFQNTGIEVNMIGFKVVNTEESQAKRQFDVIQDFPLPGRWYSVSQAADLVGALDQAMRQELRYWVLTPDGALAPGCPEEGLRASSLGQPISWYPQGLAPGVYQVRVKTDQLLQKEIALNRGDLLLIDLVPSPNGIEFERAVYSQEEFPWKPNAEAAGWRMAVLQNQLLDQGQAEMLLTLEDTKDRARQLVLEQVRPQRVWFDVQTKPESSNPFSLAWRMQTGYPAPAFTLSVPHWPTLPGTTAPVQPLLSAWWTPNQATPPSVTLIRGSDFDNYRGIVARRVEVDNDLIEIESVNVEDHFVETTPGKFQKTTCLVVRVSYAANRPVWARLSGLGTTGFEHRYYTTVNQYTGLFWPTTADQVEEQLRALSLVSLDEFKREAKLRGFTLSLDKLQAPDPNSVRPVPPVKLD
ncbi:hypothetical protein Pan216_32970 [Planctomycetes bacterium Pan216]|uniref:EF-hand domain-containing protein n=1 Tax=Kolteria novifilia TaxID=2527975 RepID=A0A518B626_9BACT|nr:hypothetical protein Pan216_32970 [Planctomycetes bacterium Pan216]